MTLIISMVLLVVLPQRTQMSLHCSCTDMAHPRKIPRCSMPSLSKAESTCKSSLQSRSPPCPFNETYSVNCLLT